MYEEVNNLPGSELPHLELDFLFDWVSFADNTDNTKNK